MHASPTILLQTTAIALAAGVSAQPIAERLAIPAIVPLLVAGTRLGPDALGWIAPPALGGGPEARPRVRLPTRQVYVTRAESLQPARFLRVRHEPLESRGGRPDAVRTLQLLELPLRPAADDHRRHAGGAPPSTESSNRLLEPGDMASPQKPVFTLALTNPLGVRAYVGEPDLGKTRPGMMAFVTTDSYPEKRYRAWIGFISKKKLTFVENAARIRRDARLGGCRTSGIAGWLAF